MLLERGDVADGGEHRDVLEAYRMFAYDRGWVHKLHEAVMTGLTAEAAVERVQSDTRARMLRQTDPYLRERLHDLDDLANRLMRQLIGRDHAPSREQLPENAILVARSMGPAALLDYDRKRLRGAGAGGRRPDLACRDRRARARHRGGRRDRQRHRHRRSGRRHHRRRHDAATCTCARRPTWRAAYAERVRLRARRQAQYRALRDKPCVTKDGETGHAAAQCRPAGRPAAYRRDRRRRHRPVPHRAAVHGGADACRAPPSSSRSTARCSTPPATSR